MPLDSPSPLWIVHAQSALGGRMLNVRASRNVFAGRV
jgi:hypothetical protein